jgi:CRP-like cAMP-binding protein
MPHTKFTTFTTANHYLWYKARHMSKHALIGFLRKSPLLTETGINTIVNEFRYLELTRGEMLLRAGDIANEYMFLEEGCIRSYLYDTEGTEITLNFYTKNDLVFEVSSFFQRIPSQENLEATTDCRGWALAYDQLNHLFHAMPEFREFGRSVLVKGFIDFKLRTLSMINKTAEQRYAWLIQSKPEIFQHAQLRHIASYLGVTDSSLSRIRKTFATG